MGKMKADIIANLAKFDFFATEEDLSPALDELYTLLPPIIKDRMDLKEPVIDIAWLEKLGCLEFIEFMNKRKNPGIEWPDYFKWLNDCLWILANKDLTCLVNIFMFNNEPMDSISDIISFKYKKKIGIEALERYRALFWDMSTLNAKDAMYFYPPFRESVMILKKHISESEDPLKESSHDGSELTIVFNDSDYIKWKIGYNKVTVPSTDLFLDQVLKDSYYKYQEVMSMLHSIEESSESGFNDKIGEFSSSKTVRRNVEEHRAKAAKAWMDMFFRAQKYKSPDKAKDSDEVLGRVKQLLLSFEDEKMVTLEDNKDILDDIKGDM